MSMNITLPSGAFTADFSAAQQKRHKWTVDAGLYDGLVGVLHQLGCKSVADLGAGYGHYGAKLAQSGFGVYSCDGTPGISEATAGKVAEKDLSTKIKLGSKWDAVLSLEVGQFIPRKSTETYVRNLVRHAGRAIILTWGNVGQRGRGHVNQKDPQDVEKLLKAHGFEKSAALSKLLIKKVVDRRLKRRAGVFFAPAANLVATSKSKSQLKASVDGPSASPSRSTGTKGVLPTPSLTPPARQTGTKPLKPSPLVATPTGRNTPKSPKGK